MKLERALLQSRVVDLSYLKVLANAMKAALYTPFDILFQLLF